MYQHDLKKVLGATVALASLLAFSGTAAHAAGITQFATDGSQTPSNPDTTAQYSTGDPNTGILASPYTPGGASGATLATIGTTAITGVNAPNGQPIIAQFESFINDDGSNPDNSGLNGNAVLAFPLDTYLLDTFDNLPGDYPNGPLQITFANPVQAFGLQIESGAFNGSYTFTDSEYDSNGNLLGTYTSGAFSQSVTAANGGSGSAPYVGAQSTSANISKVVINTFQTSPGKNPNGESNDIFFGPLSTTDAPAVPEASTSISFGLGTLLFGGLFLMSAKRKAKQSVQAS